MSDYLWVILLGGCAVSSSAIFLLTFYNDVTLVRKLGYKKHNMIVNYNLLLISLVSVGLIIYLFMSLKNQINLLG